MWAIVCCGCTRMLAENGSLIGEKSDDPGLIDIQALGLKLAALGPGTFADFASKPDADAFAQKCGWTTTDEDGKSNHRCPECKTSTSPQVKRRGAFIEIPPSFLLAGRHTPHEATTPKEAKS